MSKELGKWITLMKFVYGRDLSMYDEAFMMKSLKNRWEVVRVNNMAQYEHYLENNPMEANDFYNSLHINYSQFFREPLSYHFLEQKGFHKLVTNKPEGSEIRIWSAGCSCGQEAYSLAMLLSDFSQAYGQEVRFRIFATDISHEALSEAIAGVYNEQSVQNVRLKHLERYFSKKGNAYTISPQLRQHISFSYFDLLDGARANPPESIYGDFDVVICSNVLIYYKPMFQGVILKKCLQALSEFGFLLTGESERTLVHNITKLHNLDIPTTVFVNKKGGGI